MAATDRPARWPWLLLVLPALAGADTTGRTRLGVYTDDDHTRVITPVFGAAAEPFEGARVEARYLADVVTSASVDVVSAATHAFTERRDDVSANAGYTSRDQISVGALRRLRAPERARGVDRRDRHLGDLLRVARYDPAFSHRAACRA